MKKNSSKKLNNDIDDIKKTTANFFVNIIIFILTAIILVMSWSIYEKLNNSEEIVEKSTNKEKPSEIIQIEVLNGCGVRGIADRFTDFLRTNNYDVVNVDNYISFDIAETMIIDRIGNLANAKQVAKSLGISESKAFRQLNTDYFVDVTVIIGKDYHKLNPLK